MTIRRVNSTYIHSLDSNASFGTQKFKYNNVSAGLGTAEFYTANANWNRPSNVQFVDLILVGGGGGGGQNNYGGGGGGGNVYYIKKFYVGDKNLWYIWIGRGGQPGGSNGLNWAQAPNEGDAGEPTRFSRDADYASFTWGNFAAVGDARTITCPGGGGGGGNGNFGFIAATGGGSGSGVGAGTSGRISGGETWHPGFGFNGGAGASGAGGGGGSVTSGGGAASTNVGGNGANGPDLQAPIPSTFINSAGNTITTRFGGGGGGAGLSTQGTGGTGGGGNGGSAGIPNTGGGGGGGAAGGSGVLILIPHTY